MARPGMLDGASADAWWFCAAAEDAVTDIDFVAAKRELYARIDPVLRSDAVLAFCASGLIMSEMQAGFRSAARLAVGHPFDPPLLIPPVEVLGGRETASETVE